MNTPTASHLSPVPSTTIRLESDLRAAGIAPARVAGTGQVHVPELSLQGRERLSRLVRAEAAVDVGSAAATGTRMLLAQAGVVVAGSTAARDGAPIVVDGPYLQVLSGWVRAGLDDEALAAHRADLTAVESGDWQGTVSTVRSSVKRLGPLSVELRPGGIAVVSRTDQPDPLLTLARWVRRGLTALGDAGHETPTRVAELIAPLAVVAVSPGVSRIDLDADTARRAAPLLWAAQMAMKCLGDGLITQLERRGVGPCSMVVHGGMLTVSGLTPDGALSVAQWLTGEPEPPARVLSGMTERALAMIHILDIATRLARGLAGAVSEEIVVEPHGGDWGRAMDGVEFHIGPMPPRVVHRLIEHLSTPPG